MLRSLPAHRTNTTTEAPPLQVTIKEAARLLSMSERTIYRLLDARELVGVGSGRRRRVMYASLLDYQQRAIAGG